MAAMRSDGGSSVNGANDGRHHDVDTDKGAGASAGAREAHGTGEGNAPLDELHVQMVSQMLPGTALQVPNVAAYLCSVLQARVDSMQQEPVSGGVSGSYEVISTLSCEQQSVMDER